MRSMHNFTEQMVELLMSAGINASSMRVLTKPAGDGWAAPRLIGGNGDQTKVGNYPRSGRISMAQQKRASKKARNVKRHRAAQRG